MEFDTHLLLQDELVQPSSIDCVFLELICFCKFHQILRWIADVTHYLNTLQCKLQRLPGMLTCRAAGKDVAELRVCKFMDATVCTNGEVRPCRGRGLKANSLNL